MSLNRRTAAGAGLLVSLALVVGVPSCWALTRPAGDVGSLPVTAPSIPPTPDAPTATPSPRATTPTATSPAPATPNPPPVRFAAPRLGVTAAVDPVGVDSRGAVAIPPDARRVGWYRFGPVPGDPVGSAVLVGHRDSRTQGKGALFPMADLVVGDVLLVAQVDGSVLKYRVVERRLYQKVGLPVQIFFARSGPPRLTVITCGGPYDPDRGGYQDNLVVTAVPLGSNP